MNRRTMGVATAAVALVMFGAGFGVGSTRAPAGGKVATPAETEATPVTEQPR